MINDLKKLFLILTAEQKKRFFLLQILVILMTLFEVIGIGSIGPFMALVGNDKLIYKSKIFIDIYRMSGASTPMDFLFLLGLCALSTLILSSVISMITTWMLSIFSYKVGIEIADSLFEYYINRDWLFYTYNSSAQLTKHISTECMRITAQVILPLVHMVAKICLAFFISLIVFLYNPKIALIAILMFILAYILLFRLVKKRLGANGLNISTAMAERFRLMNEGFGGIKEIILLNRSKFYFEKFREAGELFSRAGGQSYAFAFAPRYLMEMLAFGLMISLILYLIRVNDGNLGAVLPTLGIYGIAGFKLLPAFQNIYSSLSEIRSNISAFRLIEDDLRNARDYQRHKSRPLINTGQDPIELNKRFSMHSVYYMYPNKKINALSDLSLEIKPYEIIGIVGESGSGKSTLVNLILGLINPTSGKIKVDGTVIGTQNILEWQKNIGYVSQDIYLSELTIAENIAFGLPKHMIDFEKVKYVIKQACLDNVIDELPLGIDTIVGERGVQLSGGQKQRIGIARALYSDPSILIFDEATSALDNITERVVIDSILQLQGKKTIILVAHRLTTIVNCDRIYFLENGMVRQQGNYQYLVNNDEKFRSMAFGNSK